MMCICVCSAHAALNWTSTFQPLSYNLYLTTSILQPVDDHAPTSLFSEFMDNGRLACFDTGQGADQHPLDCAVRSSVHVVLVMVI